MKFSSISALATFLAIHHVTASDVSFQPSMNVVGHADSQAHSGTLKVAFQAQVTVITNVQISKKLAGTGQGSPQGSLSQTMTASASRALLALMARVLA
jgi:hypothetical protein